MHEERGVLPGRAGGPGSTGETVGEAGEAAVLRRILAHLGEAEAARVGPGDDCAVLRFDGEAVVTSDTMIEGPDFRLAWHSGFELGWKLAATNLSDVAAMGARPTALTVSLACPSDTPLALLEEIARGLDAACRELAPGCGVVGGDLGRAPVVTAAVTALGDLEGRGPVLRSGAQLGDVVAYAGELGLSGLGLSRLFAGATEADGSAHGRTLGALRSSHPDSIRAHLAPRPPIDAGLTAALSGATAMLDVSDGLALDAARIARASGVTIELDAAAMGAGFGRQGDEEVSIDAMLFGGEDHGLLATFPAGRPVPAGFHPIGSVRGPVPDAEVMLDGVRLEPRGWDPFATHVG